MHLVEISFYAVDHLHHRLGEDLLLNIIIILHFRSKKAKRYKILCGSSWRGWGTVHRVSEVIAHDKFSDKTGDYDIALLKMEQPFKFNKKTVGPVALPPAGSMPNQGVLGKVSGWGVVFVSILLRHPYSNKDVFISLGTFAVPSIALPKSC